MNTHRYACAAWLLIAVLGAGALLTGCGQKGALYLPDDAEQTQKKNPGATTP